MRGALVVLVVAVACGGRSVSTVIGDDDTGASAGGSAGKSGRPSAGTGGTAGTATSGGSGGSIDLPDPCGIGWLDLGYTCAEGDVSFLSDPTCNAIMRCALGTLCATTVGGCTSCLNAVKSGLADATPPCVPEGSAAQLPSLCRGIATTNNEFSSECTPP